MVKKQRFYVVWEGRKNGIFNNWAKCKESIDGYEGAKYKAFDSEMEALQAYKQSYYDYYKQVNKEKPKTIPLQHKTIKKGDVLFDSQLPIIDSIATDAACSGNPGVMEYQGVYIKTGKRIFYYKSELGTNNIGEFLGIVHGLSYLKRHNLSQPLYTDSVNAMKWVKKKKCMTKLPENNKTKALFDYIHRAELWLENNTYSTQIIKWNTDSWGEIPADFGRKK
jgi:ribonuclease HI